MELFTPEVGLLFWMLIPFLVVFFILAKFAWPAILKGVEKRNNFIDESLLAAKQAQTELEGVKANSDAIISKARKEQAEILADAKKSYELILDNAKQNAREEAQKIIENARKQILTEKDDALRQIRREVAQLSVDIAEKIIREKLNQENDQMNMINRLLDEINISKS
jgi:F-type H+-transporting ATPase subunit b